MSKYRTNLSKYATGTLGHLDWTFRQANGTTSATVPTTGTLRTVSTTAGTKVLSYNPLKDIDDVEVLVQFKLSSDVGKQGIVALRYGGTNEATTTGYALSGSVISGAGTLAIDEGSTGYVAWTAWNYLPNVTYWARFRVNGNTMKAKVWTDGNTEPGSWMIDTTSSVITTGDYNGLHTYAVGNIDYTYLSWGTYGDSAPIPSENIYGTPRTITPNDITWNPTNNYQEGRISPLTHIALHWWDYPSVQPSISGVASWFKTASSGVSAHFVVSGTTIYNMVDINDTAWHVVGANAYSIGIETDPNVPTGTYETVTGLIRYLRLVTGMNLTVLGHGEFSGTSTLCPGALDRVAFDTQSQISIPGGVNTLAPIANFAAAQTNVYTGDGVTFTDSSARTPTAWFWNFGVGETSSTETFSSGLGSYTTDGDANWSVVSGEAKAGTITHGQQTHLKRTVTLTNGGFVRFKVKTSSEATYDYLRFFIDEKKQAYWSGETAWTTTADFYIPPGTHNLRWTYNKDGQDSSGSDTAWVDDITIITSGSATSTDQNPTYAFPAAGTYRVTQIATNSNGFDPEVKSSYITVSDAPAGSSRAVKAYTGGQFSNRPVMVWNGTDWIARPAKIWNGTTWV